MTAAGYSVLGVTAVFVATLAVGAYGWRFSRTTSDFFVASRTVRPWLNASAIGGEYLSAASFLGVAGLVVKDGVGALWYPVGFAAATSPCPAWAQPRMRARGRRRGPDSAVPPPGRRGLRTARARAVGGSGVW